MSREFLDQIPEHLRHIYDKAAEPNPQRTYFDTLKKQEDMKVNARENSVLYKLFGENLFGYMTIDGSLHLNINVLDIRSLLRSFAEEDGVLAAMEWELDRVGDGRIRSTISIKREEATTLEEVSFHFNAFTHSEHIMKTRKYLKEAYDDITKIFTSYTNPLSFPTVDHAYATQGQFEAYTAARRMLGDLNSPANPMNHSSNQGHHMYFRHAIKMKTLTRSIRDVKKW